MQARNRILKEWYGKIQRGELKLPRFQRHEAWDRHRIASLLETVIHDLPLGITLVLEVDHGDEKFISRFLETAPEKDDRVLEHLLDGQQRLTALWRAFHNNYELESYFVYLAEFDYYAGDGDREDRTIFCKPRYYKKNGTRYPLWCDFPVECLKRGCIPTDLLKPEDIQQDIDGWLNEATSYRDPGHHGAREELKEYFDFQKAVSDRIKDLRSIIANYNLPFLSLPKETDKSVALSVFINMNTNTKPLSQYDIIVAEVESIMEQSLHDLQEKLSERHPWVGRYADLSDLILTTSALLQDAVPNQRGAWDMDKRKMVEDWATMERGLSRMAEFLRGEGIFDRQRLPTKAVLAVIASLYAYIPEAGDKRGRDEGLLKRYLWHAFFTDRYENSADNRAHADYAALKRIMLDGGASPDLESVPIFAEHEIAEDDELLSADWPKGGSILGRAVLAVACRLGAQDFSTGERLTPENIENRHYHHIFPDALLKEAGIQSFRALNCALISEKTNISIGRKDPLVYLKDRFNWTSEAIVRERLQSHLIPIRELANGGYVGLSEDAKTEKLTQDFLAFLRRRAKLVMRAVKLLAEGRQLNAAFLFGDTEDAGQLSEVLTTVLSQSSERSVKAEENVSEPDERDLMIKEFWTGFLEKAKAKTALHGNISPTHKTWVGTGVGIRGLALNYAIQKNRVQVELYIDRDRDTGRGNYDILEQLQVNREAVEAEFGESLEWQRLEGRRACRIRKAYAVENLGDKEKWPELQDAMIDAMVRLERALRPHLKGLKQ